MHNHHPVTRIVLAGMGGRHLSLRRPLIRPRCPVDELAWARQKHVRAKGGGQ